ncbi:hypothetical protein LINGRAPRIM_LOCUS2642, partial [Linum grandiflorum]
SSASSPPSLAFPSSAPPQFALKPWTELFNAGFDLSLSYVKPILVNGVLQIPRSTVDKGLMKMKRCLVDQFLGPIPPIRVFQAMATRLWGRDGFVRVSSLSDRLFLVQFPSSEILSIDGLGFAKACVLIPREVSRPRSLEVALEGFDYVSIEIEYLLFRDYSVSTSKVLKGKLWRSSNGAVSRRSPRSMRLGRVVTMSYLRRVRSPPVLVLSDRSEGVDSEILLKEKDPPVPFVTISIKHEDPPMDEELAAVSTLIYPISLAGGRFGVLALENPDFPPLHEVLP